MPTAADIVTLVTQQLHGWGAAQDRVTPLSNDIGPTDVSFNVDFAFGQAVGITPGIVEIDAEQLFVINVDQTSGECTLANGFGRGYNRTTPATHTAGTAVVSRPAFPRAEILTQINDVIGGLYPDLFAVRTYSTTVTYPSDTYTLPYTAAHIIDVQWQDPVGNWVKSFSYQLDPFDQTFRLGGGAMIGRPLRIVYATEPAQFTSESDDFLVTGLPPSCADLLKLGAVAYQVLALDIARAQTKSAEQSDRSKVVPAFAGENAAKYAMAEFQNRLETEAASLRKRYKSRIVRTW